MTRNTLRRPRPTTAIGALVSIIGSTLVAMVGFATPTFAHHPEVTGYGDCDGVVHFTANSWSPGNLNGSHPSVTVQRRVNGGTWTDVTTEYFKTGNKSDIGSPAAQSSFGGTFTPSSTTNVQLRVVASAAKWGDWWDWDNDGDLYELYSNAGGETWTMPGYVSFPTDCDEPGATSAVPDCAEGVIDVTLTNSGSSDASVTIKVDGTSHGPYAVPANTAAQVESVPIPADSEDSSVTVEVLDATLGGQGDPVATFEVDIDCEDPEVLSIDEDCARGGVLVTLGNSGENAATVTVNGVEVVVPAGGQATHLIAADEGTTVDVVVKDAQGNTLADTSVDFDCESPQVISVEEECAEGGVVVTISNANGENATTVTVNGVEVVVPAGGSAEHLIPADEGTTVDVVVLDAHGDELVNTQVPYDCENPDVLTVVEDCAEGGVMVTLTNTAGENATTVTVNGVEVEVPADGSVEHLIPADEGTTVDVLVKDAQGNTLADTSVEFDCEEPVVVSVEEDCAEGGVLVTLSNAGELAATVTVNGVEVVVPAGGEASHLVPADEDTTVDVLVKDAQGNTLRETSVDYDCENPQVVSVVEDCAEGGVLVTLSNDGELAATVTVNGVEVVVPAGGEASHLVPADEDTTVDVLVKDAQGNTLRETSVDYDCENPQVVSVVEDCAEGGVLVTLSNDGENDTTVTVNGVEVVVPAGGEASHLVPADEDTTVDVLVKDAQGNTLSDTSVDYDCENPQVLSVLEDCAEDGVAVTISNASGENATTVTVNGDEVVVPAGGQVTHVIPADEDTTVDVVVVDSHGTTLAETSVEFDCENPQVVSVVEDCAEGGVVVTISNDGVEDTTVTVNGDEVAVPAGDTVDHLIPADEDSVVDVVVLDAQGGELANTSVEFDCENPEVVSVVEDCAEGGILVTLSNDGENDATVTVNGVEVVVPAGGQATHLIEADEGTTVDVLVVDAFQNVLADTSIGYDCENPQVVSIVEDCAKGGVIVTISNDGESDATVTVNGDEVHVPAGGSTDVHLPADEGTTVDVLVLDAQGNTLAETSVDYDCENPVVVSVVEDCAEGGVVVTLSNDGESDTTVTVNGVEVAVPAGQTVDHLVPADEDTIVAIEVLDAQQQQLLSTSVDYDCENPSVISILEDCAEGGAVVTLTNDGENDTTVYVNGEAVDVPAGATVTHVVAADEDTSVDVTVLDAQENVLAQATVAVDCENPSVISILEDCTEGGVVVTLSNDGENDTTVTVNGTEVSVPAGGTVDHLIAVDEDGSVDVEVLDSHGEVIGSAEGVVVDCEDVEAISIGADCAEGGAVVLLTNGGENDATATVNGAEVVVPGGTTAEDPVVVLIPLEEDETVDVTVLDGQGELIGLAFGIELDCQQPAVLSITEDCDADGHVVTLTNDGEDPATVTVTSDGIVVDTVEVAPGATVEVLVPMDEGETTTIEVTDDSNGDVLASETVTLDCTEVLGEVIEPEPEPETEVKGEVLARTGAENDQLLQVGVLAILFGLALVVAPVMAARRETA